MKTLLLCLAGLVSTAAGAQGTQPKIFRHTPGTGLEQQTNGTWQKLLSDSVARRNSLDGFSRRKPGVYRLPQDGMPCIVPDSTKTVAMPNLWRGKKEIPYRGNPPRMPNLAKPQFLSYSKPQP